MRVDKGGYCMGTEALGTQNTPNHGHGGMVTFAGLVSEDDWLGLQASLAELGSEWKM